MHRLASLWPQMLCSFPKNASDPEARKGKEKLVFDLDPELVGRACMKDD